MTTEERQAVREVVIDKITGEVPFTPETLPPEGVGRSGNRYQCDHCPVSFTIQSNLTEHLERKHRVIQPVEGREDTATVFVDTKIGLTERSFNRNIQTKQNPIKKKSRVSTKSTAERRKSLGRTGVTLLTHHGDAGTGNICRLCSKEFLNNGAMRRHFEDIHCPGEYPCKGCGKMFTSKNKVSSHYSRNCKRKSLYM